MLKIFEKNTVVQVIFILGVTALLWFGAFANPQPMMPSSHYAPLYNLLLFLNPSPVLATVIALILVVVGGLFFNIMLVKVNLASQNSLLPTLLFIIAMSAGSTVLSPSLLAALIVVLIVKRLLIHSTLLAVSSDKIFSTAALIGIASMIFLPALILILAYLLIAINYRLYGWRDWMMFLLGLLAPYLLLWAVQFMTDDLAIGFAAMASDFGNLNLGVGSFTTMLGVANGVLLGVFVISLFVVWVRMGEKTIMWQKNATTIMLITVAAVAMLPFTQLFTVDLHFLAIPFAFCLYQRFTLKRRRTTSSKRTSWRDYFYDILFIIIIVAAFVC